jgi:hypothetical protein
MNARQLVACGLVTALCGCKGLHSKVSDYPVLVRAADDLGKPLANVQLSAAGKPLGATELSGERSLSLPGTEGQRVELTAVCPPGYTGPRERPVLLLKRAQTPQTPGLAAIELSVTCDASEHVSVVAIRTGQPNVPVLLHGQAVALTSTTGTAHVVVREAPGSAFQLTLDTSAKHNLHPQNPARMFTVAQRDAFAVWDQPLELEKAGSPSKKQHKKAAPAAAPTEPPAPEHIPERL